MPAEKVTTVLGEISPEALGFCQMHEHIMLRKGVPALLDPALMADDIEKSTQELSLLRAAGGCTVVDAQPIGCGRMAAELAEASRRSGITVIASTGFHVRRFYPSEHWLFDMTETDLEKLFCREITDGMYENCDLVFSGEATKHRAGIVKAALEERGLGKTERKLFAAAAFAARCCNVPLMIHTDRDSNPLELMDYLLSCDLPPEQMIFCHLDRTMPNGNVAKTLCAEGAYLEYDTIGRFKYHSDKEEIRRIEEILDAGWVKRLLLSLDTTYRRMLSYGGDIGLNYLLQTFLPAMHNSGISEAVLERIMRKNPKEVFGS